MHYIKSLFFNILVIFLSLHIFNGVEVTDATQIPHIGGDLLVALGLGLLNSLIYPILRMVSLRLLAMKIFLCAFILNFMACGILKIVSLGVNIESFKGYAILSLTISVGSFLINFFERKPASQAPEFSPPEDSDMV
ncbi:MAG: phage holin family protein [Chlamydiales bacterium]|nr:phage holin family protein [Chlamydiales bacterium]